MERRTLHVSSEQEAILILVAEGTQSSDPEENFIRLENGYLTRFYGYPIKGIGPGYPKEEL